MVGTVRLRGPRAVGGNPRWVGPAVGEQGASAPGTRLARVRLAEPGVGALRSSAMSAAQPYEMLIVGMGSAGIVAAEAAATLLGGRGRVGAVERERIGGDCLWTGCVPSKALLASAKAAHTMRHADAYGLLPVEPVVDPARVWARLRAVQDQIAATDDDAERFRALGVDVIAGAARLTGPGTVQVAGHGPVAARRILIATGSRPAIPPIPGLEAAGYLTSETVWADGPPTAGSSLLVIGGGPVALELAQAHQRLGFTVTVLEREDAVLPRDEPTLVATLVERLRHEGVAVHTGADVVRVDLAADGARIVHVRLPGTERTFTADTLLVAAGRAPNVEQLGLEAAGVAVTADGITVDDGYATSVKGIWAAGDVAGRHRFTHSAGHEAARAVRNMLFPGTASGAFTVPWCTFTDPELAHVGLTEAQARAAHPERAVRVWRQELAHSDRARTDAAVDGAVVIVTVKGRVVGGHVLAPAAGETIHELALAVHQRLKLTELASMVHVYPTIAVAVQQLAGAAAYAGAARYRRLIR